MKDVIGHILWRATAGILTAVVAGVGGCFFMDEVNWETIGWVAIVAFIIGALIGPAILGLLTGFWF